MKRVFVIMVSLLLVAMVVEAKVLTYQVGGKASSSADQKWKAMLLTWAPFDSTAISILSDSTAADEDTTNAFDVGGLFAASPRDTVGLVFFHTVADTVIDSLRFAVDYSLDGSTWIAGTYTAWFSGATYNGATGVADSTVTQYVLGNPSVAGGMQIFAPFQRVRAQVSAVGKISNGPGSHVKKLKSLTATVFFGGR